MDVLQWILGLEHIRLREADEIVLRFSSPPSKWVMLFGAIAAVMFVAFAYLRRHVPTRWRAPLFALRLAALMLALFVCGRPVLVLPRTTVEPSCVAILLDESASMAVVDPVPTADGPPSSGADTRWRRAVASLTRPQIGFIDRISPRQRVGVWTFGDETTPIFPFSDVAFEASDASVLEGATPDQPRSDLVGALSTVFAQTGGRRLAAVVVVSDGRDTVGGAMDPICLEAAARQAPVHGVVVGSPTPRLDIGVESVWAPSDVFVRDAVSVEFRLSARGVLDDTELAVELRDAETEETLATDVVTVAAGGQSLNGRLPYHPPTVGTRRLAVVVRPPAGERSVDNNEDFVTVTAHDATMGVLYVESEPRFEYRYLKNLLLRESNIVSSCLLLRASADFRQDGSRPISNFPRSVEELRPYDVMILGDVDPRGEWLTPVQSRLVADFVSAGGGLIVLAGEQYTPHAWRHTSWEALLPIRLDPHAAAGPRDMTAEFAMKLTPLGAGHPILSVASRGISGRAAVDELPGMYWYAPVKGAMPATTVLAVHPADTAEGEPMPLLVAGRVGEGRTLFVGTDDLWRWRTLGGEAFYEGFWIQAIHSLARARKLQSTSPWRLETDRRRYELSQPVHVNLTAADAGGKPLPTSAAVVGRDESGAPIQRVTLRPAAGGAALSASFVPRSSGAWTLTVEPGSEDGRRLSPSCHVTVVATETELRRLEADPARLQEIARQTGGRLFQLDPADLERLAAVLPDRRLERADDLEEPIWDSPAVLLAFVAVIGAEWMIRRLLGMA
jgi:uncharacterized membrane protein